jgi:hypothetical protein
MRSSGSSASSMMPSVMDVAINELSFRSTNAGSDTDTELLRNLTRLLKSIKDRVANCDRERVHVRVTDAWPDPRRLPRGTTIGDARSGLDDIERGLCDAFFTDYPSFPVDDPPVFFHDDEVAYGLGYAHTHRLLAASLAIGRYAVDELLVESRHVGIASGAVPNVWRTTLPQNHVATMAAHVQVMPLYTDPGHHDPGSPHYVSNKSHIPRGAKDLFHYAHSDDGTTWWAKCECNFFHRFQGGDPVHWNGTTSPRALQQTSMAHVPGAIRAYWRNRAGIADCGCR